jgi:hypothetical protein
MKVQALDIKSCETAKEYEPSIRRRTCVMRSPISQIQILEVRKGIPSTSRVAKSQGNLSHSSESGHMPQDPLYWGLGHQGSEKEVL